MDKKLLKYLTIGVGMFILFLLGLFFWINCPDLLRTMWLMLVLVFWPLVQSLFKNWLFAIIVVLFLAFLVLKKLYFRK